MGGDQVVIHVARVGRGIAQAGIGQRLGQHAQQPAESPGRAIRPFPMPGIHILAEKGDFAGAL